MVKLGKSVCLSLSISIGADKRLSKQPAGTHHPAYGVTGSQAPVPQSLKCEPQRLPWHRNVPEKPPALPALLLHVEASSLFWAGQSGNFWEKEP